MPPKARASGRPGQVMDLQQKAGNRATVAALKGTGGPPAPARRRTDKELLTGPMPDVGDPDYARAVRARILNGNKRRADEKVAQSGVLGWLGSWLPGQLSYESPKEGEEEDDDERPGSVGYEEHEVAAHDSEEAEEESAEGGGADGGGEGGLAGGSGLLQPIAPTQVFIVLDKVEGKASGTRAGDVAGSVTTKLSGEGALTQTAKGSVEGSKAKGEGEASLETRSESLEGKGKIDMVFGARNERKTGTLGWGLAGAALEGSGELASFAGAKLAAEASAKYDMSTGDLAAAAKAGALVGVGTEATVKVKLKAGGVDYGETEGKLGLHFGLGGEVSGTLTWTGGVLNISTAGKYAFGPGASYSYKVTLNTNSLAKTGSSLLASLWSWMTTVPEGATEEDFWV